MKKNLEAKEIINNEYLQEIIKLDAFADDNFDCFIKAVDALFYFYIQECLFQDSEIMINHNQVYEINEVKRILELLGKFISVIKNEQ